MALGGGLVAWAAAMIGPTVAYIWPARTGSKQTRLSAGPVKEFPAGSGRIVASDKGKILVIRVDDDKFRAFSAKCTHLGCLVQWNATSKHIECPCHAAVFGTDGKVISGPPPTPLPEFEVMTANDEVIVKL